MPPEDLIGKYAWVNEVEGWTVAVMKGRPVDEVVRIFGGDPLVPLGRIAFDDLDEHRTAAPGDLELFLQILDRGEHLVTFEQHGWSGAFPEIARRCSAGGWFFSVYWNIHAAGSVTHAVDGEIRASFDSLQPFEAEQDRWDRRPDWAIGPEVDVDRAWPTDLAMLEQRTGVEIDPGWLSEPLPTYRVPEPYWLYRDLPGADRV